jgi:hypothetical protein
LYARPDQFLLDDGPTEQARRLINGTNRIEKDASHSQPDGQEMHQTNSMYQTTRQTDEFVRQSLDESVVFDHPINGNDPLLYSHEVVETGRYVAANSRARQPRTPKETVIT